MWCRSHRDITNVAIDSLKIKRGELTHTILRNICSLDRARRYDRRERFAPHHWGRHRDIVDYIFRARMCYLNNDLKSAGRYLAWALHLIQDHCVSTLNHNTLERSIAQEPVKDYVELSEFRLLYSFRALEEYIHSITPKNDPKEAIISALSHTMTVLKSVVAERREPPSNLLESLRSLIKYLKIIRAMYKGIEQRRKKKMLIRFITYNAVLLSLLALLVFLAGVNIVAVVFTALLSEPFILAMSREEKLLNELRRLGREEDSIRDRINVISKEIAWHSGTFVELREL